MIPPRTLDPVLDVQSAFMYAAQVVRGRRGLPAITGAAGAAAAAATAVGSDAIMRGAEDRWRIHVGCIKEVVLRTAPDSLARAEWVVRVDALLRNPGDEGLHEVYSQALALIPEHASGSMPFSLRLYATPVVLHDGARVSFSLAMEGHGVSGIGTTARAHQVGLLLLLDLSSSMHDPCVGGGDGGMVRGRRFLAAAPVTSGDSSQAPAEVSTKRAVAIRSAQRLIESLPEDSPVQVIGYHDVAEEFFRGTPQELRLRSLEERIPAGFSGGTCLVSVVDCIASEFFAGCVPHSITALIVTDGQDYSLLDDGQGAAAAGGRGARAVAVGSVHGVPVTDANLGQGIRKRIVEKLGGPDAMRQTWNSVRVISLGIGFGYNESFLRGLSGGFLSGLADPRQMDGTLAGFRQLMGPREPFWACVTLHQKQRNPGQWRCLGVLTDGFSQSENVARIMFLARARFSGRPLSADLLRLIASYFDNQGNPSGLPKFYSLVPGPGDQCLLTAQTGVVERFESSSVSVHLDPVERPSGQHLRLMAEAEGRRGADAPPIPEGAIMAMLHMTNPADPFAELSSVPMPFCRDLEGRHRAILDSYRKAFNAICFGSDESDQKIAALQFYERKLEEIRGSVGSERDHVEELLRQLRAYRTALRDNDQAVLAQYEARAAAHAFAGHRSGLTK